MVLKEVPARYSGGLVFCAPNEADACKEENSAQDSVDDDTFNIPGAFSAVHEVHSCQDQSCCAQKGEYDPQYAFFHNRFLGKGTNNVPRGIRNFLSLRSYKKFFKPWAM